MTEVKRRRGRPPGQRDRISAAIDPEVKAALDRLPGPTGPHVNRLLRIALNITA